MPIKIDLQAKTADANPPKQQSSDQVRESLPENKIRPIDLRNFRKSKVNIADLSR